MGESDKVYKKLMPICRAGPGSLLGEESLFSPHRYKFSYRVESSTITILLMKRSGGLREFKRYSIFTFLKKRFEQKE